MNNRLHCCSMGKYCWRQRLGSYAYRGALVTMTRLYQSYSTNYQNLC